MNGIGCGTLRFSVVCAYWKWNMWTISPAVWCLHHFKFRWIRTTICWDCRLRWVHEKAVPPHGVKQHKNCAASQQYLTIQCQWFSNLTSRSKHAPECGLTICSEATLLRQHWRWHQHQQWQKITAKQCEQWRWHSRSCGTRWSTWPASASGTRQHVVLWWRLHCSVATQDHDAFAEAHWRWCFILSWIGLKDLMLHTQMWWKSCVIYSSTINWVTAQGEGHKCLQCKLTSIYF